MLLNLLNFFDETAGSTEAGATGSGGWVVYLIFGVMIVLMIVMMIVSRRKAKKQQEEMQSKLTVGVVIMTIGGIIGEIVKMEGDYIWIATGLDDNKQVMQLTSRAIHSIVTAPTAPAADGAEPQEEVVDEIK